MLPGNPAIAASVPKGNKSCEFVFMITPSQASDAASALRTCDTDTDKYPDGWAGQGNSATTLRKLFHQPPAATPALVIRPASNRLPARSGIRAARSRSFAAD